MLHNAKNLCKIFRHLLFGGVSTGKIKSHLQMPVCISLFNNRERRGYAKVNKNIFFK